VCFNQSGNAWSQPTSIGVFPTASSLADVQVTDLLGVGTACLVWSSPLPADADRPVRYVDLMGGSKPHLLVTSHNNLGAELLHRQRHLVGGPAVLMRAGGPICRSTLDGRARSYCSWNAQYPLQMSSAEDQEVIQALRPCYADEPLGEITAST